MSSQGLAKKEKTKRLTPAQQKDCIMRAGMCMQCGQPDIRVLEVHHIRPIAKGGSNSLRNLSVLCPTCHKKTQRGQLSPLSLAKWNSQPTMTERISPDLVKVYISLRKAVLKWEDPRNSYFREWTDLDQNEPHLVGQIKRTAPSIFDLCNEASALLDSVHSLRYDVGILVRDKEERLAQEYQSKFDEGEKVKFSQFTIKVDGGNERPLYLEHAWVNEKSTREWAEIFGHEIIFRYKTWELEVVVTGRRMGNTETRPVAKGDEAIVFGDKVLSFLKTQQTALDLQRELRKAQELRKALLSRLGDELAKAPT